MSAQMDCFVDEVKDGGKLVALGVLFLELDVLEGLDRLLRKPIVTLAGAGAEVGEVHWSSLSSLEAEVAMQWLTSFLSGPLMFFVLALRQNRETKAETFKRLVERLESDPRVPGGFSRRTTTVHFDANDSDPAKLLRSLRRDFGMLRAFKWASKGTRLIQLCDILLGVTNHSLRAPGLAPRRTISKAEARRQQLISGVKAVAADKAAHGKINSLLVLDAQGIRCAFAEQGGAQHWQSSGL